MSIVRSALAVLACLLALLATGCGSATPAAPEGTWTGREDTRLELTTDGQVTGSDGCNYLSGSWSQDGETIVFSGMISTLMACMDVDVWLSDPATATITGTTMTVYDSDGTELGDLHRD